jgi:hypothetical protein
MCIMHMMPGPSSDGEFIHSFNIIKLLSRNVQDNGPPRRRYHSPGLISAT